MAKKKLPNIVTRVQTQIVPSLDYSIDKALSHSQLTIYDNCPFRWKLQYKDKLKPFGDSMNTVFGKAIHEVIQKYLEIMYSVSKAKADTIDIEELFRDKFKTEYQASYKKNKNIHFSDPSEMTEYFEDGMEILNYFKKNASTYFSKRGWHFLGYELPINYTPSPKHKTIKYIGYLDLVFYNEFDEHIKIVDIKTSKKGWGKWNKEDKLKTSQLVLYKKFFSEMYEVPVKNIDVEYFIVKRKLYEESDFPQKRIQTFVPASGTTTIKNALTTVTDFINEVYDYSGKVQKEHFSKKPSENNCMFCPFKDSPEVCDKKLF